MKDIIQCIILIASLITAVTTICMFCKKIINKGFEPIYARINKIDENQCKSFLVNFLVDKERGIEQDEVLVLRAHEVYKHYKDDLHKNSYIHDKWEKLMK
jgi:hypothetical protein|nr:MAG TPA: hypothetical protein [Caudoviricetes sp.]